MEIKKIETNKKQYLELLLLADEQEDMIDRYLERGTMYVLEEDGVQAECVVTDEGGGILDLLIGNAFGSIGPVSDLIDIVADGRQLPANLSHLTSGARFDSLIFNESPPHIFLR